MTNPQSPYPEDSVTDYREPIPSPQSPSPAYDPDRNLPVPRQSHIISTILSPAVRLWLRSQVEHVEDLQFHIDGGDRQLLSGLVPRVTVAARNAIYQGLYLSRVQLMARGIKVNFGQILRGRSLRLERTVPVQGELVLFQQDLNASLESPLLAGAVTDLLTDLLKAGAAPELVDPSEQQPVVLDNLRARIEPDLLSLRADIISARQGTATPFVIRTGLRVSNGRELCLVRPEWLPTPQAKRGFALDDLDGYSLNLGTDVEIQELLLQDGRLICRGKINVVPAEE